MAVQVPAGYWDLDIESRELLLCPQSRRLFGIDGSRPKKLGKLDWLPRIHPDDMPMIDGELEAARRNNEVYSARFRVVRPDGSICQIVGVGRATAKDPKRFVGLNFDLVRSAAAAELESRRPFVRLAKLTSFLTARSRPANENESPRGKNPSWSAKRAAEDSRRFVLLRRALGTMEARQLRHKFLNPVILGEPAFDMLLALYVTNASPAILPLSVLGPLLGVSELTADRWLRVLVNDGLALSVGSEGELGAISAALTDKGRIVLDAYFKALDRPQC